MDGPPVAGSDPRGDRKRDSMMNGSTWRAAKRESYERQETAGELEGAGRCEREARMKRRANLVMGVRMKSLVLQVGHFFHDAAESAEAFFFLEVVVVGCVGGEESGIIGRATWKEWRVRAVDGANGVNAEGGRRGGRKR